MSAVIMNIVGFALALSLGTWGGRVETAQSIRGTVFDPDGAVVAKARVMLMQDYVKLSEMPSDEKGGFSFDDLAPGRYQVQIKQPMFSLFQQTVDVKEKEHVRVYAILPLGRMSEEMRVNAQPVPNIQRNSTPAQKAIRGGGKIEMAKLLKFQMPDYPPGPDSRGVEGDVVIYATIKSDGSVVDLIVISSPDPDFEGISLAAVRNWRYRPMKLNGHPVDAQVTIALQFRL
jgi:TonB family protein